MKKNKIEIDQLNSRIVAYLPERDETILHHLEKLQKRYDTTKTICYIDKSDSMLFLAGHFVAEGSVSGFFSGRRAIVVSRFYSNDRSQSTQLEKQKATEEIVKADKRNITSVTLPPDYKIEHLKKEQVEDLVFLYKTVFAKYPTNVFDKDYLLKEINKDYFFVVVTYKGTVVSAASAMINSYGSAEITDCATDPKHRGKNLLYGIILELEKELRAKNIYYAYSNTRSVSTGMNITIKRLGYTFEGKLVNNCMISTGYEDMNIWTKTL